MRRVMSTGSILLALAAAAWGGAGCIEDHRCGGGNPFPEEDPIDAGMPDVPWNVSENPFFPDADVPDAELDATGNPFPPDVDAAPLDPDAS